MQPFLVVNRFQKVSDLRSDIGEVLVFAQLYLLILQSLHKALSQERLLRIRFSIVVGISLTVRVLLGLPVNGCPSR